MKRKNKLSKLEKGLMVYDVIACIAILTLFGWNMLKTWNLPEGESLPYFNQVWLSPIGLCLMGTVAFTAPYINKTATGDPEGENVMKIVALLFFVMAIITLIMSMNGITW